MSYEQTWRPAPRQGLVPLYPFGFGTALGRSFTALRGNPKVLLGFAVTVQTLSSLAGLAILAAIAVPVFTRLETVDNQTPAGEIGSDEFATVLIGSLALMGIAAFVISLLLSAINVIVQGVVVAEVSRAVVGEKASLRDLWAMVAPRFWPLAAFFLLQLAAATVVAAIAVAPVVLGVTTEEYGLSFLALPLVLAMIPLYVWLSTKLYLTTSAIVIEKVGPIRGIGRSWALTRGRFWPTFGVMALIGLIMGVVSSIASFPLQMLVSFLPAVLMPLGQEGDPVASIGLVVGTTLLGSALQLLMSAISTIVTATGGALMYVDARMRHEGLDLRLQSYVEQRELGSTAPADPWTYDPSFAAYAATPRPGFTPGYLTPEQAYAQQAQQAYAQQGYAQQAQQAYAQQGYAQPGYPAPPVPPVPQPPYAAQPYAAQPYAAQPYAPQPGEATPPPAPPQAPYPPNGGS